MQADATSINIDMRSSDTKYVIHFKDNGKGITDFEKDKIFDENFTTKKQGMGLGLSMAKRFMTSIDGEINLKSSNPQETTFEILFQRKTQIQ